jgi:hypothetical protein
MWVWVFISILLILIGLLVAQRWKVTGEWLRMERELSPEDYALWRKEKERTAERWSERMKKWEAGFLFLFAGVMMVFWFLI